jgi:hypothetical protein
MTDPYQILLFLLAGGGVCIALHILIGAAKRSLVRRFVPSGEGSANAAPSVKILIFDWTSYALRAVVWILYLALLIYLLQGSLKDFSGKLAKLQADVIDWLLTKGIKAVIAVVVTIFL